MRSEAAERSVEAFIYRDSGRAGLVDTLEPPPPLPTLTENEALAREERARREARMAMEQGLGADLERRVGMERAAVAAALEQFGAEREQYFQQLEREVVQLALGIARKLLQREAQLDPLLLSGAVRVALDQLAAGTEVSLYVPISKMTQWEEMLRAAELHCQPQLRSDPSLEPVGCRIETATGATDLSLEAQLREVEQGFMDLLNRRAALGAPPPLRADGPA
ncbi:MAG: FliH/SctL family protein [Terriglobales bacterium]